MKIRFTEDRWLKSEDLTKRPKFRKGSTHDLPQASAYRWVRRNVAVYVVAEPVAEVNLDRPMMSKAKFEDWADGKPKRPYKRKKSLEGESVAVAKTVKRL